MIKFYDTNALLTLLDEAFKEPFVIADITLAEIENIKTSAHKDETIKYKARKLAHLLVDNEDKFNVIKTPTDESLQEEFPGFNITNDFKIVWAAKQYNSVAEIIFVTDDLLCRTIAKNIFGSAVRGVEEKSLDEYTGYKEVVLSDTELADLYNDVSVNRFDLLENQYLLVRDSNNEVVDILKWKDGVLGHIKRSKFKSGFMEEVKPYRNDPYQKMLFDALVSSQFVLINGSAGTGKSYIALAYLLQLLDKHAIDKIVVFTNTVPAKGAAKLGFYPGSRTEKLVDSQIGIMLGSKLGGTYGLEYLISQDKIELLPMSDIRGYDTSGKKCAVYITEAQNFDIELMRLALQRVGEDTICVIDGDFNTQVDMPIFDGANNGMRKVSEVFKGEEFYAQVTLKNIYRSKIAEIAQKM